MKVRDSGMPEEEMWSGFFDPSFILKQMEVTANLQTIADLGCGFGTFSIPAANNLKGKVHAFDIDEKMISQMQIKIDELAIKNIELHLTDFIAEGTGLPDNSVDYVMIFNILHHDNPKQILSEIHRLLKKDAKAGIIHWRSDISTPRGPSPEIRPKPQECVNWAMETGFKVSKNPFIIKPYHFGLIIQKP
jgi:ubiquinone/menaquinone biosynthesis C-methylase UbiE